MAGLPSSLQSALAPEGEAALQSECGSVGRCSETTAWATADEEEASEEGSCATAWSRTDKVQVIVVGGGLAGLAAANAILEGGGQVLLLEKGDHTGGNSAKTTGGINAAGTSLQRKNDITDSADLFFADMAKDDSESAKHARVLCESSSQALDWLTRTLGVEFTAVEHVSGHSVPRTHRTDDHQTGKSITRAMIRVTRAAMEHTGGQPGGSQIITRARVVRLLTTHSGACCGCVYRQGQAEHEAYGPVVLCTGGFAADFAHGSLLSKHRPDLLHLPTASVQHCTGDGIRMAEAVGAKTVDLEKIQVLPTGLEKPDARQAKVKLIADGALLEAGGLILNQEGCRMCNELGNYDSAVCEMWKSKAPFRLVLNRAAATEVISLCKHFVHTGAMRFFPSGEALAKDMGVPLATLEATHEAHYKAALGKDDDQEGGASPGPRRASRRCNAIPGSAVKAEPFYVAVVTPVISCCLGGLETLPDGVVRGREGAVIRGLYAAGEVAVGLGGTSRWGGNSLLECMVFGRLAGAAAAEQASAWGAFEDSEAVVHSEMGDPAATIATTPRRAPGQVVTDLRMHSVALQLERFLETRLTASAVQAALATAHLRGGDLEALSEVLRSRLRGDAEVEPGGPVLSVSVRDVGSLNTPVAHAALPDAGCPCGEMPVACVHCRLPLTLEFGRQGSLALTDAEASTALVDADGPFAYVTLLYGDKVEYFLGALVLGWSLKATGSLLDLLLLHTDDVPAPFLGVLARYWTPRQVQYLEGSSKLYKHYSSSRFKAVFTKLQALSCTDYSKVLMMDLDMLVRRSLDELFRLRAPAALKRSSGREQPEHGGSFCAEDIWRPQRDDMCSGINAGVMLLRPEQRIYERMVAEVKDPRHPEHIGTFGPEQDYLARFYTTFLSGHWTHLHAKFNYQLMLPDDYCSTAHKALDILRDVVVAHYSGPRVKPWKLGGELDAAGTARLLQDDTVYEQMGREQRPAPREHRGSRSAPPPRTRERIMDGVLVVEPEGQGSPPPSVQGLMWEWVQALRSCVADLGKQGVNVLSVIEEVQHF